MFTISSLPTIDVLDVVIAIQAARIDGTNDVTLEQVYSIGDVGIIRLAAKCTGCFVTFTYVDADDNNHLNTIEVY